MIVDELVSRSELDDRRLMKVFALVMASVIGATTMPVVNPLHAWSMDLAGNRIRQDAQPKKEGFADPVLQLQIKHERGVTAIAFSPDGKLIATGSDDYTIQLWDLRTGRAVLRLNEPDSGVRSPGVYPDGQRVFSLSFSPDGRILASAGDIIKDNLLAGGQVTLWEIPSGKLLRTIIVNRDTSSYTTSVTFTPDGKGLVAGVARVHGKGEISQWNAQTGAFARKWKPNASGIHSVTFSPDGLFLVAGCSDAAIKFLDSQTWELRRTLRGAMYRIFSLSFFPDGETLASCVGPNLPAITGQIERLLKVHLIDRQTGRPSFMTTGHRSLVTAVAFSPDGEHLASGDAGLYSSSSHRSENGMVNIWRTK
jgi:WD40 repeat protein